MNESEYITDVETTEEPLFEDSTWSDSAPVTEMNDVGNDSVQPCSVFSP